MRLKGGILAAAFAIVAAAAIVRPAAFPATPDRRPEPVLEEAPSASEPSGPAARAERDPLREKLLRGEPVTSELLSAPDDRLRSMAADDPDERCRAFAVRALSLRPDPAIETFLAGRLLLDRAVLPRYAAARGLARLESLTPAALGALEAALRSETNEKLIDGIRDALSRHGPRNAPPLGGDEW